MYELALFAGAGGAFSVDTYLAGIRSAQWNLKNTRETSSFNANETESSPHSPSGMMSAPLMENPGEDSSTSSPVASLVKTSQQQEKAQELQAPAQGSGRKCTESFAKYDPATHSWKTAQCSLHGDLEPFLETWPKLGIMLHGSCLELPTWVLPTREKEYGSLQLIPTPTCRGLDGGAHSRIKLKKLNFFPTPISHNAKELTACPSNINRKTPGLGTLAAWGVLGTPGRLNPDWVEWLMGWPLGWTDLKPLATAKYHSWLQQHSES